MLTLKWLAIKFENASVIQDGNDIMIYPKDGEGFKQEIPYENPYVNEVVEFIKCIREDRESQINPPDSSMKSLEIALAEKVSADTNKTVQF